MTARPVLVVLRALGLGDFLTGVPAYRALARTFPEHRRVLAVPAPLHALLPLLGETFGGAVSVEALSPLPGALHRCDVAVNLHGRGPQSHRILLQAHPARLIAFAHEDVPESRDGARWQAAEHEVARWMRMLGEAGIAVDSAALDIAVPATDVPSRLKSATIVHPGAASPSRRWPLERWAHVVRACARRGENVVLTGAPGERAMTSRIAELANLPAAHDVAGQTSLLALAALVAGARRVLCADTGMAHLATAYRVPSVVLFGPVAPSEWGPPARLQHRVIWAGRPGDPHAAVTDPGLLAITPQRVLWELERLPL